MVEEVAGDEGDHLGVAAGVVAEVEDDGAGVVERCHGGGDGRGADGSVRERIEFEIADVVWQYGGFLDGAVLPQHGLAVAFESAGWRRAGTGRQRRTAVDDLDMRVVSDGANLFSEQGGEGFATGCAVVGAVSFLGEEGVGGFLREGDVEVVVAKILGGRLDDVMTFGRVEGRSGGEFEGGWRCLLWVGLMRGWGRAVGEDCGVSGFSVDGKWRAGCGRCDRS
jgi:hypothetical protein